MLFYGLQCRLSRVEDWTKCVGKVLSFLDVNDSWSVASERCLLSVDWIVEPFVSVFIGFD